MFESIEESVRLTRLEKLGDPLRKLDGIDWVAFGLKIHRAFERDRVAAKGGRPRYDDTLMFKILVLQRHNNLGDDAMEYLVTDRSSYRRFLGLASDDAVPDAKTIHRYRDELAQKTGLMEELFDLFRARLDALGLIGKTGVVVDGTFVEAPRQRNSREENAAIKDGELPPAWFEKGAEAKLRQKDVDARWTKKGGERHYGYKDHVKIDPGSKLILKTVCSAASLHDSKAVDELLDESDRGKTLHADSAYRGAAVGNRLAQLDMESRIHEQGVRGRPLDETQKRANTVKSRVRVRVEHAFGVIEVQMGGACTRLVGLLRNRFRGLLTALVYNMIRRFQIASPCRRLS